MTIRRILYRDEHVMAFTDEFGWINVTRANHSKTPPFWTNEDEFIKSMDGLHDSLSEF